MTTTDLETVLAAKDAAPDPWVDWEPPATEDGADILPADVDTEWVTERSRWLVGIRKQQARNDAIAQRRLDELHAEIAWIEARATEVNRDLERKASWIEGILKAYALARRARSCGREKTTKLLYATVKTRESAERWEVADTKAVEEWARREKRPEVFVEKVTRVLDKTTAVSIAKGLLATGEFVDGIVFHPKGEKITADVIIEGLD